jgi:hypothetical protein
VSADGRLLACGHGGKSSSGKRTFFAVSVHDLVRRQCLLDLPDQPGEVGAVAFALGGTALAYVSGSELLLRDLKSGTELCRRTLADRVTAATFSPDGSRLAFIRGDRQVVIDGLEPNGLRLEHAPLSNERLDQLWLDLAAIDPRVAYRAVYLLSATGDTGVRFLAKHVQPVPPDIGTRIRRLIADLDHDEFARREAAHTQLALLGLISEKALREALPAASLESRSRITRLLDALGKPLNLDRETQRHLRAIHVLQRIGSRDARALLQRLAAGAAEAQQTRAAATALRLLRGSLPRK